MSITIEFLDVLIRNNNKVPKGIKLKKPERDYLKKIQRSVWEETKRINNKKLHQKVRQFNVSCDRLIHR